MDHAEALKNQLADRYLLGELSEPERERFEEHYFGCPECVAELEAGRILSANAIAVFRDELATAITARQSWWSRFLEPWGKPLLAATSLATCLLGAICLYQTTVVIPQLARRAGTAEMAMALPSFQLAAVTRGDIATVTVPRDSRWFAVSFDIDPQPAYTAYLCELTDQTAAMRFKVQAPPPQPGQPVSVLLPARDLQPGKYKLSVSGLRGNSVARVSEFAFVLQFK